MSHGFSRRVWVVLIAAVALAAGALAALGLGGAPMVAGPRLIHEEPSQFAPVVVFDHNGERCMSFNTIDDAGRQTCFRLSDPDKMVFEYTRMMTSALFAVPAPNSVLVIGLGGGTLPTALAGILPHAVIDSVEIDPAVVQVAQTFFGYRPGPRQRVFVQDGREFVEQAGRSGASYDLIMLDAFDVDYIPAHLLTVEFLQQVKAILAPEGALVANSFARSDMYERESATYAAVFGAFFNLRSRLDGNRVIIAMPGGLPPHTILEQNAQALSGRLAPFGIDVETALSRFSAKPDWNDEAQPLRD
ncbi:MAG TPA: fused MFS/spermidine synthase [Pusillimonas sp.]|uniref:spermidine synthase n=1 Tax=Pusillimonas sp. TaxID=3040095 RepID=UPI002B6EA93F|nr:fused MFS/spermidine synthase [Pusillimonas sp.]HUH86662.1 fused MFS/spermidine synthase [Pusillimonas sp.]